MAKMKILMTDRGCNSQQLGGDRDDSIEHPRAPPSHLGMEENSVRKIKGFVSSIGDGMLGHVHTRQMLYLLSCIRGPS